MRVKEAIEGRRSIRKYSNKPVEDTKLKLVLEAGRLAPSARNNQDWRFIVVRDPELKKKLMTAANNQEFVGTADSIIVGCGTKTDYVMRCGQTAYPIDVAIAMTQMTLQAVELELGTCWVGSFYQDQVKELLGIPEDVMVVQLLTLGYPESVPESRPRKSYEEVICFDGWQD